MSRANAWNFCISIHSVGHFYLAVNHTREKMARKTTHEAEKEAKPIVGTQIPMHEGDVAVENFEALAKKIFSSTSHKTTQVDR
jgi:CheY-specific phosphatase CheX